MKLTEAVDKYYEDENEENLYLNVVKTWVKLDEMEIVLKDTLGDKYDFMKLIDTIDNICDGITKSIGCKPLTNEDFD